MENNSGINLVVEQITLPSFNQFCRINEAVDDEMRLYSEIASNVDKLKTTYGEKELNKTGIIKSLSAINNMILTCQKETQTQQPQAQQPQAQQPQAQQPQVQQPQAQQPQAQQPQMTQATQPQAQAQPFQGMQPQAQQPQA